MLYRTMRRRATGSRFSDSEQCAFRRVNGKIDEARASRQIRHAIDQGVNYVDTAWGYHRGASEPFVGRALADGYREKVRLATKLPHWAVRSREDMDRYLAQQLERLRTDRIDYYLIHSLDGPGWQRISESRGGGLPRQGEAGRPHRQPGVLLSTAPRRISAG